VNHYGLNDQITTATPTRRCRHFLRDVDVKERDGPFCVITGTEFQYFVMPHTSQFVKGHEVTFVIILCGWFFNDILFQHILAVFHRSTLRLSRQFLGSVMSVIEQDLHVMLGYGSIAFIKV
jgi:hypothetical protein